MGANSDEGTTGTAENSSTGWWKESFPIVQILEKTLRSSRKCISRIFKKAESGGWESSRSRAAKMAPGQTEPRSYQEVQPGARTVNCDSQRGTRFKGSAHREVHSYQPLPGGVSCNNHENEEESEQFGGVTELVRRGTPWREKKKAPAGLRLTPPQRRTAGEH